MPKQLNTYNYNDLELASKYKQMSTTSYTSYFFNLPRLSAEYTRYIIGYAGVPLGLHYLDHQIKNSSIGGSIVNVSF